MCLAKIKVVLNCSTVSLSQSIFHTLHLYPVREKQIIILDWLNLDFTNAYTLVWLELNQTGILSIKQRHQDKVVRKPNLSACEHHPTLVELLSA